MPQQNERSAIHKPQAFRFHAKVALPLHCPRQASHCEVELLSSANFIAISRMLLAEFFATHDFIQDLPSDSATQPDPPADWIQAAADDARVAVKDANIAAKRLFFLAENYATCGRAD